MLEAKVVNLSLKVDRRNDVAFFGHAWTGVKYTLGRRAPWAVAFDEMLVA